MLPSKVDFPFVAYVSKIASPDRHVEGSRFVPHDATNGVDADVGLAPPSSPSDRSL